MRTIALALVLVITLASAGCAPAATTQLPPATSLAVTAEPPAAAASATVAPQPTAAPPTAAPEPTVTVAVKPEATRTQAAQPADKPDLVVTILHTNDVDGETEPCG